MNFTKYLNPRPSTHLPYGITELNEARCGSLCQHPSCWTSQRRQDKGIPGTKPITNPAWSSGIKNDLPMQSICNILSGYGDSICHYQSESAAGDHLLCQRNSTFSRYKLRIPTSKRANIISKPACGINSSLPYVEAVKVLDSKSITRGLNDLCRPKQSYIWIPSPKKIKEKLQSHRNSTKEINPNCTLIKDFTDYMMPEEIIQRRQNTVLFADWPTLKKKHAQSRTHPEKISVNKRIVQVPSTATLSDTIYSESYFTSRAKLHSLVLECPHGDATDKFKNQQVKVLNGHAKTTYCDQVLQSRPRAYLDDFQTFDTSILLNMLPPQKDAQNMPDGCKEREFAFSQQQPDHQSKMASVSLGLPELPIGVQATRPFSYMKQDLDFSLGPAMSTSSSYPRCFHEDYSHIDTTVIVGVPSTMLKYPESNKYNEEETSISPGLATHAADTTTAAILESGPAPEDRSLTSELVVDCMRPSVLELADTTRQQDDTRDKKILDEILTTESPAPPPPSPEPRS